MSGVKRVIFTDQFWDSYDNLRRSGHLRPIRRAITDVIRQKLRSTEPVNARDQVFKKRCGALADIGHIAIRRNPDCVMFYVVKDDTLFLAMLGSHHDYPNGGKHLRAADRTANRIWTGIRNGDRPSPNLKKIKWSRPSDLTGNRELFELQPEKLFEIMMILNQENHDTEIYRKLFGKEIDNEEDLYNWLDETEAAEIYVRNVIENIPKSGHDMFAVWDGEDDERDEDLALPSP